MMGLQAITAEQASSVTGVRAFEQEILRYGRNAAQIFAVADCNPDCPLAQAYAALAHICRLTREGQLLAAPYVRQAERAVSVGNRRERLLVAAISRWHAEDQAGARMALSELLLIAPWDIFSSKLLQLLHFNAGDARGMLRTIMLTLPHHGDRAEAHGMLAFALDQCGQHEAAEIAARHAIALGEDPWAFHALAHVLDARGAYAEGRDLLTARADAWADCSSFMFTHNWWHNALFHLELGDDAGALELYDQRVWGVRKDYCQDQINAISLLARLELTGADVGARWSDVSAFVRMRRTDVIDGFLDLHYAYALARGGDDEAVEELIEASLEMNVPGSPAWRALMPTALDGIAAFARGQYDAALSRLTPLLPSLHLLGGSTVQRDLVPRLVFAAQQGVGRCDLAA